MDDLVQWLRAQLDEDERLLYAADGSLGKANLSWSYLPDGYSGGKVVSSSGAAMVLDVPEGAAAHIAEHDPARALREIDAKRRILAEHWLNGWVCDTCDNGEVEQAFPCMTLRLLALPYADRPGYRSDWAPTP